MSFSAKVSVSRKYYFPGDVVSGSVYVENYKCKKKLVTGKLEIRQIHKMVRTLRLKIALLRNVNMDSKPPFFKLLRPSVSILQMGACTFFDLAAANATLFLL